MTLHSASGALWSQLGSSLALTISSTTRLYKWESGVKTPITLSQVNVGGVIWSWGTIDRSGSTPAYDADVLTVQAVK